MRLCEGLSESDLAALRVPLLATSPHQGGGCCTRPRCPGPCAWLLGHEGQGVSDALLARADMTLRIVQPGGESRSTPPRQPRSACTQRCGAGLSRCQGRLCQPAVMLMCWDSRDIGAPSQAIIPRFALPRAPVGKHCRPPRKDVVASPGTGASKMENPVFTVPAKAILALADGTVFIGASIGATGQPSVKWCSTPPSPAIRNPHRPQLPPADRDAHVSAHRQLRCQRGRRGG